MPSVINYSAERVFIDDTSTYALTFTAHCTNVWQLTHDGRELEHVAALETTLAVPGPGPVAPVIDASRAIVIVIYSQRYQLQLGVFSLKTGKLLVAHRLNGSLDQSPIRYSSVSGRALLASAEQRRWRVLVLDVNGQGIEGTACIPEDLRALSENDRRSWAFNAVHLSDDGDIVGSFARGLGYTDSLTLLRWTGTPDETIPPATRAQLPLSLGDEWQTIYIRHTVSLGSDAFVACALEDIAEVAWHAKSSLSVLCAVETRTLEVRWTVQFWAKVHRVEYDAKSGLVFALGAHNPETFLEDPDELAVLLVAAIDARTGELRREERIKQTNAVAVMRLTQEGVVLLFENGDLSFTLFEEFVAGGLRRNQENDLAVIRPSELLQFQPLRVVHAAMAAKSIVVATEEQLTVVSLDTREKSSH